MAQVTKIWTELFYGISGERSLPKTYETVKTWKFGDKVIRGQIQNQKILRNGNIQKRITTIFEDGKIGLDTKVYTPKGELLKAYAGIRTTGKTVPIIKSALDIYAKYNIHDAKIL